MADLTREWEVAVVVRAKAPVSDRERTELLRTHVWTAPVGPWGAGRMGPVEMWLENTLEALELESAEIPEVL